jgi:hypothetical protein
MSVNCLENKNTSLRKRNETCRKFSLEDWKGANRYELFRREIKEIGLNNKNDVSRNDL